MAFNSQPHTEIAWAADSCLTQGHPFLAAPPSTAGVSGHSRPRAPCDISCHWACVSLHALGPLLPSIGADLRGLSISTGQPSPWGTRGTTPMPRR